MRIEPTSPVLQADPSSLSYHRSPRWKPQLSSDSISQCDVFLICYRVKNTGKCHKMLPISIPVFVQLLSGSKEASLKAVCSDQETAGNGSNLTWSHQELKVYSK